MKQILKEIVLSIRLLFLWISISIRDRDPYDMDKHLNFQAIYLSPEQNKHSKCIA